MFIYERFWLPFDVVCSVCVQQTAMLCVYVYLYRASWVLSGEVEQNKIKTSKLKKNGKKF